MTSWLNVLVRRPHFTPPLAAPARRFSLLTGRFTQEDPLGLAGGFNLYGFAAGDPVNFSDPFGLAKCPPHCRQFNGQDGAIVFGQLAQWAPEINREVATFIPKNMAAAAAGLGLGKVIGALFSRAAGSGATSGEMTFYRGVSQAEAADVAAQGGKLRAGAAAAGNAGKYLTNTVEAAAEWGAMNGPGSQVLSVTVPADATSAFVDLGKIDGIGQAWWAPLESLAGATVKFVTHVGVAAPK